MKNIYKIERYQDAPFNREKAVKLYQDTLIMRRVSAPMINAMKKTGLFSIEARDNLREKLRRLKTAYLYEFDRAGTAIRFSRRGIGDTYQLSLETINNDARRQVLAALRDYLRQRRNQRTGRPDPLFGREPGSILRRYQSTVLSRDKRPADATAEYVGIEIECITRRDADMGALLPFAKWVNVGRDGSITHDGGEMGQEIRVCLKRDEVRTVIPGIMDALNKIGARVNRSCGLHVHLDQRNNPTPELTFQKLVRSLGLLYTVVPKSRRENTYCKRNLRTTFRSHDRYRAINPCAYQRYKTIEVRLFGGTLNAEKVINWIETLEAISHGEMVNRCPKNFDTARKYWQLSDENVAWLKARQIQFAPGLLLAPTSESDTDTTTADGEQFAADNEEDAEIVEDEMTEENANV